MRSIEDILKKFDPVALCNAPVGIFDEVSGVKNTSMPFATHNIIATKNNSNNNNNNINGSSGLASSSAVNNTTNNNTSTNTMHQLWSAEPKLTNTVATTIATTVTQNAQSRKSNELTLSDLLSTK